MKSWTIACLVAAGCAACGGALERVALTVAPREDRLPGVAEGAVESVLGVRVEAVAGTWDGPRGEPIDRLVPIFVRLHNGSPAALQIAHRQFALVSDTDRRYAAVPPSRARGALEDPTLASQAMRMQMLPEDELTVGGWTEGFVYFEAPDPRVPGVSLRAELIAAGTGERIGVAEIAFVVAPR